MESEESSRNLEKSAALRRQLDYEAIAEGIAEMEAGGGLPLEQAHQNAMNKVARHAEPPTASKR